MPRAVKWAAVIASLIYALLFVRFEWGGAAAYILVLLPGCLAWVVSGTWLAGLFVLLLPGYFVIGQLTAGQDHHQPLTWLDRAMPLQPAWIGVYASLYMCGFILPLVVVRGRELIDQVLKAYLFVMLVSYAGFWLYPTVAPRTELAVVSGFAEWALQLFYDLDQPWGCFPSLHVGYTVLAALACYRMHRVIGAAALAWAALIGLSTVYTKQHYAADAIAGAAMALTAYLLFLRGQPPEPAPVAERELAPRRAAFVVGAYGVAILIAWIAYQAGLGPVRR